MRFEARDLTDYAQPVEPGSLRRGEAYFSVQYVDEDCLIPTIETIVFVGRNLDPDDTDLLYFQDVECYQMGIKYGSGHFEDTGFRTAREDGVKHIFDYESALNELMKCSLRRAKRRAKG